MSSLVELRYNPYKPLLKIKINGNKPNAFSRLIQFADEDIWNWCDEILDIIYSEIKDDFYLGFTGREQDVEIMRYISEINKHCLGYKANGFEVNDSLQKRMGKLNQLIIKNGINSYRKTLINANFIISTSCHKVAKEIETLDINNLFCSVKIHITDIKALENQGADCFFIIDDNMKNVQKKLEVYQGKQKGFVILLGVRNQIIKISKKVFAYEATEEYLFNTIFNCFLSQSLLLAFRNCIHMLEGNEKDIAEIIRIEPEVNIAVDTDVEVGKSNKITIDLIPEIGALPNLIFKVRNGSVASCDGMNLYGIREGRTQLEAYKEGEEKPFVIKDISVIKRNRITQIILSDDMLTLGIGDKRKIKCDYVPENADNTNEIIWKSSDETVVSVDNMGNVTAKNQGTSRIMCIAENVSATCICTVKPYLSDICIKTELDNGELKMEPLEELELEYELIPKESFDDKIIIKSSNMSVINTINQKLMAKSKGTVEITIENNSGRICKKFAVQVQKNKVGIFKRIFK